MPFIRWFAPGSLPTLLPGPRFFPLKSLTRAGPKAFYARAFWYPPPPNPSWGLRTPLTSRPTRKVPIFQFPLPVFGPEQGIISGPMPRIRRACLTAPPSVWKPWRSPHLPLGRTRLRRSRLPTGGAVPGSVLSTKTRTRVGFCTPVSVGSSASPLPGMGFGFGCLREVGCGPPPNFILSCTTTSPSPGFISMEETTSVFSFTTIASVVGSKWPGREIKIDLYHARQIA